MKNALPGRNRVRRLLSHSCCTAARQGRRNQRREVPRVITISSASRASRGLPVPGAFPGAGAWRAAGIGANGACGATGVNETGAIRRPTAAGTSLLPGQALAQPTHMYMDKARTDAGKRDATGSQPRRAPV